MGSQQPNDECSTGSSRDQTIVEILFDAMVAVDHKAPTSDGEYESVIQTWTRVLEPVPDHELERAYVAAARKHTSNWLMNPGAIVEAYREARQQGGGMQPPSDSQGISYSHQQYLEQVAKISRRAYNYAFSHPDRHFSDTRLPAPPEWKGYGHVDALRPSLGGPIVGDERAAVIHAIFCGATGDDIRARREGEFAGKPRKRSVAFDAEWSK